MCDICRQYPCDPRCPNSEDPPIFDHCFNCGEPIYDGDECYEIRDREYWCEECISDCRKTAEVDW